MKIAIIQGSARSDGHTSIMISVLQQYLPAENFDLLKHKIGLFDYKTERKRDDDFIPLISELIKDFDVWIFATPVYWYTMSAQMKIFFDRMTDCITTHKELGRLMSGKSVAVLSCGSDGEVPDSFCDPFIASAKYMNMRFIGHVHTWSSEREIFPEVRQRIKAFVQTIHNSEDHQ